MDNDRGRLPVQGNRQHISPQPSPNNFNHGYVGLDPAVDPSTFTTNKFNTAGSFSDPFDNNQSQNNLHSNNDPHLYTHNQFNHSAFQRNQFQDQSIDPNFNPEDYLNTGDNLSPDFGQDYTFMDQNFNMHHQSNVNPADLNKISSPDQPSPGAGLLSPEHHTSPGPQAATTSPPANGQFHTPQHSRHTSLDPASAYDMGNGWQGMQFQQPQHRRAPSDQFSDVSSVGRHSPYMAQAELHDTLEAHHSPFLAPQNDNTYGIESFNIADQARSLPNSTYVSPRLMPQQGLGLEANSGLGQEMNVPTNIFQPESYQGLGPLHHRNLSLASEMGQADQFAPPTIIFEPAPVSRQTSFGPQGELMTDALSPPPNTNRGRNRSKSDVTFTRPINSRSVSPSPGRDHSGSLSVRSTSPGASPLSRESSPGVASGRISKDRRASTSSMHSRDYILDLADPGRPNASAAGSSTRVQKHPATFQCNLCPKRFTRAYNLRSHLRTHTDERPFVCTVCHKAFARQHDRKRHEGLHSGEKKFVCKGELHSHPGQNWGCGRRFARADALGRHFRSEAGRVCIKPLLDEEAAERRNKQRMDHQLQQQNLQLDPTQQHQQQSQQYMASGLQPVPPGMMIGMDPTTGTGGFALPAALMAQYPQLANIDWNALSQGNLNDDPDLSDVGGYDGVGGDLSDTGEGNYATGNYVGGSGW